MLMGDAQGTKHQPPRSDCQAGKKQGNATILEQGKEVLTRPPTHGTTGKGEGIIQRSKEQDTNAPNKGRSKSSWICPRTWLLVERWAALCKEMKLTQADGRRLGCHIYAAIKADCVERARKTGELVMVSLSHGNVWEA